MLTTLNILTICAILSTILSIIALIMAILALTKATGLANSTHTVAWQPVPETNEALAKEMDALNKQEKEFLEEDNILL
jgi:nitrogen fixation protein FixH